MANNFESIILEKKSSILTITLNRPDILNAYNIQMRDEMWQALLAIKDDQEVKVIILMKVKSFFSKKNFRSQNLNLKKI